MTPERWQRIEELFDTVLARPAEQRAAFLQEACAGDDSLRREVEVLLASDENADGEFEQIASGVASQWAVKNNPQELVGQHLGHFRIDAVLGAGGMGVVYLACDERLGRKVGLKLLPRALVNDEAQLERLKFEARTASALNHPNIVTVHEIGQVDSTHYIAIEFIEGTTVRERIAREPVPPEEALEITTQVASALCVAHGAGIVHRDIKPENIMIRPDGYVKVLDFGIAKSAHGEVSGAAALAQWRTETRLGVIVGTSRYMSPEQARGESVDARSDIWSVGVVLYEMLTGRPPFPGDTATEVRTAVLQEAPAAAADAVMPGPLRNIVDKCLRKDPAERFQTCEELLGELKGSRDEDRRRLRRYATFALVSLLVLTAAGLYLASSTFKPTGQSDTADASFTLRSCTGVAVDADGVIYVADFSHHTIRQIRPDGAMSDFAGSPGISGSADGTGAAARFNHPADVAIGPDKNLYVADTNNHVIRKITPAGVVSTLAGKAGELGSDDGSGNASRFNYPTGLSIERTGSVYVADFGNHTIRKITAQGVVTTVAGTAGENGAADGIGAAARFNQVHGVAVDGSGNVYAADFGNHTIRKITPDGTVTTFAGLAGNPGKADGVGAGARFSAPYGVAVDQADNIYVADTSNHTIRRMTPAGVVSTLAGVAGNVGSMDGRGGEARFAVPAGATVDKAGNVYVADFGNHSIRKITPAGDVSTTQGRPPAGTMRESSPNESFGKSIAVLPFVDLSQAKDQEYFCDGMSEELLDALAHVEGLRVVARTSSFAFKGKNAPVSEIAQKLGVEHLLEGSLRREGNRIRITAQLIHARNGFHVWSETFERELQGVFAVQDEITHAIVEKLKAKLALAPQATATPNAEAHELYLRALYFSKKSSEEDLRKALALFQQTLEKDPNYGRAWTGIANVWLWLADEYVTPLQAYASMEAAASKALALNPNDAQARCHLGEAQWILNWDPAGAEVEVERALAIDPNSVPAHLLLALLKPYQGDCAAAIEHLRAAERLDPLSTDVADRKRGLMIRCHRFDEALAAAQQTIALDPSYLYGESPLANVYRVQGKLDEALALYLKAAEMTHHRSSGLALTYANLGRDGEAREVLRQLLADRKSRYVRPDNIAWIYAAIGEREESFAWLETAYREHTSSLPNIAFRPEFQPLQSDPRFGDLVRRIGLDPAVVLNRQPQ